MKQGATPSTAGARSSGDPQAANVEPDEELRDLIAIARAGAAIVMGYFGRGVAVELKGPDDPVTRADREANDEICRRLATRFPQAAIVAEESAPEEAELRRRTSAPTVLFVDPLDGTREFVRGIGEFAVMIGLAVAGAPAAGVVALPVEGVVVAGRVGLGAWRFDDAGRVQPLWLAGAGAEGPLSVVVSRSRPPLFDPSLQAALGPHELLACGSVGVKVARLLFGRANLYLHRGRGLKLWDACGPDAVVQAAGGIATDWTGAALRYRSGSIDLPHGFAAAAPRVHRRVLPALRASLGSP